MKKCCLSVLLAFAGTIPAVAQTGATATFLGTITDPSGAIAAGVQVTAVNT